MDTKENANHVVVLRRGQFCAFVLVLNTSSRLLSHLNLISKRLVRGPR